MIKVFIYDDSDARKDSLMTLLDFTDNMQYVGSANNCSKVIEDMTINSPDIVLMDIEMPFTIGLEGLRQIKLQFPHIKVIMQTVVEDINMIFKAFQYGAEAYILKKASIANITDSIEKVYSGQVFLTPSVASQILIYFSNQICQGQKNTSLTEGETEVLQLISKGYGNKIIAKKLHINDDLVNKNIKNISTKLQQL